MNKNSNKKNTKDLSMQYLAIVYLVQPFYSDERGEKIRARARKILLISKQKEDEILNDLLKRGTLRPVGKLLIIGDQPNLKKEIGLFMDKNKSYLSKLIKEFII